MLEIEIVWKKVDRSGGNDGGDCVWVADVGAIRKMLGEDVPFRIYDEEIPHTTDVLVRDEADNLCHYSYREFSTFIRGVKDGDFDSYLMKDEHLSVDREEMINTKTPVKFPIIQESGVKTYDVGYIEIDAHGRITGKIIDLHARTVFANEHAKLEALHVTLTFRKLSES